MTSIHIAKLELTRQRLWLHGTRSSARVDLQWTPLCNPRSRPGRGL